tara:strand:- start:76 stop:3027 length:2952 start_codon:yes stop_codon:yes gene_type:complete
MTHVFGHKGSHGPAGMKIPNPGGGYGTPGYTGPSPYSTSKNYSDRHPGSGGSSTNTNTTSSSNNYSDRHPGAGGANDYNNNNDNYSDRHEGSGGSGGNDTNSNSTNNTSSNESNTDNHTKVIDFISSDPETDANWKSYTTINYANNDIQNVTKKVNQILKLNPKWTKMDALNYLDGKWTKMGYADNSPRWNNGRLKDLEITDEIASIKGGQDFNTWGGGLRSSYEGNWGTLTDKETYTQNLDIRANSQHLEPGSPAWLRNKQLSEASKMLSVNTSQNTMGKLGGFVISSLIGFPVLGKLFTGGNKREAINEREQELLQSPILTEQLKSLMEEYDMVADEIDDYEDTGNLPLGALASAYSKEASLRATIGGDIPKTLRNMTMDSDNLIFNKPMNEGELKNFKSRLRMIEEDRNDNNDDNKFSSYGSRIELEEDEEESTDNTTIDLVDPYIGVAWWRDRGGFEKLFGLPLPYAKKEPQADVQMLAKEGGKVGYQLGGTVRPATMINDPNAAPASMRADDVDLQAQEGDFIMGYPAMQQNGPRVRSLVERAMLRAKDAGVKTKGYKHGDKVDILVHNGEMHIPNELVKYVDGGYTSLKKLNAPSKHYRGDVVQQGFMEKPEQTATQENILDEMQGKIVPKPKPIKPIIKEKPAAPDFSYTTKNQKEKENDTRENVFYQGKNLIWHEDRKWNSIKASFKKNLPEDYTSLQKTAYTNVAMNDLYNALQGASPASNRDLYNKLKSDKFLKQLHKSSKANMLMSNAHTVAGKELNYNTVLDDNGLTYQYDPSNLFSNPKNTNEKNFIEDNTLITFLKKEENDGYKKQGIHLDHKGNKTVGFGHKIENKEEEAYFEKIINDNGGVFPKKLAERLLIQDITLAKNGARKVYNNYIKSIMTDKYNSKSVKIRNFDDLDKNRQMMLTELAFNLGYSENTTFGKGQDGLAEFDDFMRGVANNNYTLMNKEYTRLDLDRRNKNFYTIFLSPSLDKL